MDEDALQYQVKGVDATGTPVYTALGSLHQAVVSPIESFVKSYPISSDGSDQMNYDPQIIVPLPLSSMDLVDISQFPSSVLAYVAPLQTSSLVTTPTMGPVQVGKDSKGNPIYKTEQTGVDCSVSQTAATPVPSVGTPSGMASALSAMQ